MNLQFLFSLFLFLFHTVVLLWEEQAWRQHHCIFFFCSCFFKALKTLGIFGGFTFEKGGKQQILVIILGFPVIFQTKMVQHIRKKHPEYAQLPNTLHTPLTTAVISATPAVLTTDSATGETVVVSV